MKPLILIWFVVQLLSPISTLPSGGPESACSTLTPIHANIERQATPAPYRITPYTSRVGQGQTLALAIESNPQNLGFGGFMLHAVNVNNPNEVVGRFEEKGSSVKLINCNGVNNTATHMNPLSKNNLELEWTAPDNFNGEVIFRGTVAQDYSNFWVGIESRPVQIGAENVPGISTTRQPQTTTTPRFEPKQLVTTPNSGDPMYDGCSDTKGCFGLTDNCVRTKTCAALAVIHVEGERYQFELQALATAANKPAYVAIGLSDDNKMGNDSVIECVAENGEIKAYTSYTQINPYGSPRTGINQNIVRLLDSSYIDGTIYCKFERQTVSEVLGKKFDLINSQYHLLLAVGDSLKSEENSVGYHSIGRIASSSPQFLADTAEFKGASVLLLRLHGAFMLIAWIGTASLGIIFARYFKQTWVGNKLCGLDQWFVWHRVFMVLTWLLTIAAFVIIFVEIGGLSSNSNPHIILGIITTVICFLQPIGALFRPAPGSKNRPIFNWIHWLGGNVAHILAIATIFYAVQLTKAELPQWMDWILVAFVLFHVLMHIVLSIGGCISDNRSGKRVTAFPMTDLGPRGGAMNADRKQDAPHATFRKVLLGLYIIIITLFVVALVLIAVLAPIEDSIAIMKTN